MEDNFDKFIRYKDEIIRFESLNIPQNGYIKWTTNIRILFIINPIFCFNFFYLL